MHNKPVPIKTGLPFGQFSLLKEVQLNFYSLGNVSHSPEC